MKNQLSKMLKPLLAALGTEHPDQMAQSLLASGKVVVFPCAVGDTLYLVNYWTALNEVTERKVLHFDTTEQDTYIVYKDGLSSMTNDWMVHVFPTYELAKAKLEEEMTR